MDKPVLKNSLQLFERFGKVRSRSMFGGFGIFVDDAMFALVVNNALHIRACETTNQQFKDAQYEPYVYKKRGFPVVTKYFALPNELWQDEEQILSMARIALDAALVEKASNTEEKPERLKDLPNLRLATERMLKKAGISTVAELRQQGAASAYMAIKEVHDGKLSLELLWSLEGALKGTHWSVVSQERRNELESCIK